MRYENVYIDAFGYELAPNVVTSDDLEDRLAPLYDALHLQKGQLEALTGIRERRYWDPGVRMRASDAVEKISRTQPDYLQSHKTFLLKQVAESDQQEVRWHLAQIIPRLELSPEDRTGAAEELFAFLDDPSKIVQTNARQALVDLAFLPAVAMAWLKLFAVCR